MKFKNDKPFSHQGIQVLSFLNSTQFVKERKICSEINISDFSAGNFPENDVLFFRQYLLKKFFDKLWKND